MSVVHGWPRRSVSVRNASFSLAVEFRTPVLRNSHSRGLKRS